MIEKSFTYSYEKPELNEYTLEHYGVKGMKWRKRKAKKDYIVKGHSSGGSQSVKYRSERAKASEAADSASNPWEKAYYKKKAKKADYAISKKKLHIPHSRGFSKLKMS